MIIINKSGHLKYKNLKFKCALGKAGIGKKKQEGSRVAWGLQKTAPTCFQFAFNLLSTVQIAREVVRYKESSFTLKQCKRTKN